MPSFLDLAEWQERVRAARIEALYEAAEICEGYIKNPRPGLKFKPDKDTVLSCSSAIVDRAFSPELAVVTYDEFYWRLVCMVAQARLFIDKQIILEILEGVYRDEQQRELAPPELIGDDNA